MVQIIGITQMKISDQQSFSSSAAMQRISVALRMELTCGASLVEGTEEMSSDVGNHRLEVYCAQDQLLISCNVLYTHTQIGKIYDN